MARRFIYQTHEGVKLMSTDNPTYSIRKRAARMAKAKGYTTLQEVAGTEHKCELSHYIK